MLGVSGARRIGRPSGPLAVARRAQLQLRQQFQGSPKGDQARDRGSGADRPPEHANIVKSSAGGYRLLDIGRRRRCQSFGRRAPGDPPECGWCGNRRRARVDDRVAGNRSRVLARHVTAGIAVVHVPDVARDMLLENHDVAGPNRRHARRRRGARKASPIAGKIQFGNDVTEAVKGSLAAAERMRTSRGTTADDPFVVRHRCHRVSKVQNVMRIMTRAGFGLSGESEQCSGDQSGSGHVRRTPGWKSPAWSTSEPANVSASWPKRRRAMRLRWGCSPPGNREN